MDPTSDANDRGEDVRCAAPSVDERLERLRGDVNALFRLLPDELERRLEGERQDRWHATYNAVRGGMEAATVELLDVDDAHEYAAEAADRAHGPLEAKP
jgi:hypothetical protein